MAKKQLFIKDIKSGQTVDKFVGGLSKVAQLKDKNSNTYYDIEIVDKSGIIKGKIWSNTLDRIERIALNEGNIVSVSGNISEYRGELQLVVNELFLEDKNNFKISDFVISADKDIEEMWDKLLAYIDSVENQDIKKILDNCLDKYGDKLKVSPAAERLHHAYVGGLLEHMIEMLSVMEAVKPLYPEANYDYIIAGVIFHDIGKIEELNIDGFNISRTTKGKLIGHLIISYEIFQKCVHEGCNEMVKMKLDHIILSHHGILEYGSPVVPKTIEAIIFHKLDDLSSNVRQFKRVIDESEDDAEFSKRDWALGTEVYLG